MWSLTSKTHPRRTLWVGHLLGWTVLAALLSATMATRLPGMDISSWGRLFLSQWLFFLPWALLTPWWFGFFRSLPLSQRKAWRGGMHVLAALIWGSAMAVWNVGTEVLFGAPVSTWDDFWRGMLGILPLHLGIYGLCLGGERIAALYRRHRQREADLVEARWMALQSQVHPHFLFNTLNTISTLVEEDGEAARRMIARLGRLLRSSLSESDRQLVTLDEELELARLYLEIEEVRFEDRLRFEFQVEEGLGLIRVPPLLLQPLLENSIRHGIARRAGTGHLGIRVVRHGEGLRLQVEDDGVGMEASGEAGGGLGLHNIRARLEALYGERAHFVLTPGKVCGTLATVDLPVLHQELAS